MAKKKKIVWFAAGGGLIKGGPHKTQVAAWEAMRLTEREKKKQGGIHPTDTRVWPEEVSTET